jgi:hypothetical protein
MHNLTEKELLDLAESTLGDKIVDAVITKGHLAEDWPDSIVATRRERNEDGVAETIHDLYIWEGTYHKFTQVKELYREVDTVKKATMALDRKITSLQNDLEKLKSYLTTDLDYVTEIMTKIKKEIAVIEKSII